MRRIVGALLLLVGVGLVFYPQIEKYFEDRKQAELIESFELLGEIDTIDEAIDAAEKETETDKHEYDEELAEKLDGARGIIQIPKIDLEMVFFEGVDTYTLSQGIGMIEPHKEIGVHNVGLAGHRSVTHGRNFNRLEELDIDDIIEVKTPSDTYEFEISDTFVVHQSEVDVLEDGDEPLITLVTCTPLGQRNPPTRLIIQGKLKQS